MADILIAIFVASFLIYFAYKLYSIESGDFKERKTS